MASLTEKSLEWTMVPSAAIVVPSSTIKKSPMTISLLFISSTLPSLITLEIGCEYSFNLSKAFLILDS